VLKFIAKYREAPASLADACLVRMTEALNDPIVLTTDRDFGIYRRHGREAVPCVRPTSGSGRTLFSKRHGAVAAGLGDPLRVIARRTSGRL
jgi:hypothetical protein